MSATAEPDVSVVVPVYRNADSLLDLQRRLSRTLEDESLSFESIFVDDASPDGSLSVLTKLVHGDQRVGVVALAANVGQHRAVLTGLRYARGTRVVVMDADLQDPPEAVPKLLAAGRAGFAAVFAGRSGRYEPWGRLLTSRAFKRMQHLLAGVPVDAGMFVALDRRMVDHLLATRPPSPSVVAMIGKAGLPVTSVPVARCRRSAGRSAYTSSMRVAVASRALAWALAQRVPFVGRLAGSAQEDPPSTACMGSISPRPTMDESR